MGGRSEIKSIRITRSDWQAAKRAAKILKNGESPSALLARIGTEGIASILHQQHRKQEAV